MGVGGWRWRWRRRGTRRNGTVAAKTWWDLKSRRNQWRSLCLEPLEDRRLLTVMYQSTDVPRDIIDQQQNASTLQVPEPLTVYDLNVIVSLDHYVDGELTVTLRGPHGPNPVEVDLLPADTIDQWSLPGTVFDDEASQSIIDTPAPFFGEFRPAEPLSAFDAMLAQGEWTLLITNGDEPQGGGEVGRLLDWSLVIEEMGGTIQGNKWVDLDGDRLRDQDEPPLEQTPIFLDQIVSVQPSDYSEGTLIHEIRTPGIPEPIATIEAVGFGSNSVFARESEPPIPGRRVFGHDFGAPWPGQTGLNIEFDPQLFVSSVSLQFFGIGGGQAELVALNQNQQTLDRFETEEPSDGEPQVMTVSSFGEPITRVSSRVLAGLGLFDSLTIRLRLSDQPITFTNAAGDYEIRDLLPGDYAVWEGLIPNWEQTYPGTESVTAGRLFALRGEGGPDTVIAEIDPLSGHVLNSFPVPDPVPQLLRHQGLAVGPNSLFYADGESGLLFELDPDTGTVIDQDPIDRGPLNNVDVASTAYFDGRVYLGEMNSGSILVVDPASDTTVGILTPEDPVLTGLAGAEDRGVLYSHVPGVGILEIDPRTGNVLRAIPAGQTFNPMELAYVDGELILAGYTDRMIGMRIDPQNGQTLGTFDMRGVGDLSGLGGDGAGTGIDGSHRVTIRPNQVTADVDFGNRPTGGEIRGGKWLDVNSNGVPDGPERRLEGWPVYVDGNENGELDSRRVFLEPDNFAPGSLVGGARPEVTLTTVSDGGGQGPEVFTDLHLAATTGQQVFRHPQSVDWEANLHELRMDFHQPVTDINIDFVASSQMAVGSLRIFDSQDRLLAVTTTSQLLGDRWERLSLSRPGADIAYAVAGSLVGQGLLDNLSFTFATEPVTWSDRLGEFQFDNLPLIEHTVAELLPPGWRQTFPGPAVESTRGGDRLFALRYDQQQAYIDEFDASGNLINSVTTPLAAPDFHPEYGLAYGDGRLFLLERFGFEPTLHELNPDTGEILDSDLLPPQGQIYTGLAYLDGFVYVADLNRLTIAAWDPDSDRIVDEFTVDRQPWGGLTGSPQEGLLYAVHYDGGPHSTVVAIDPGNGQVVRELTPELGPLQGGLAYFDGELIAGRGIDDVQTYRIDPTSGRSLGAFSLSGDRRVNALGGNGSTAAVTPDAHVIFPDEGGGNFAAFGNTPHNAEIRGVKWHDLDGDGTPGPLEPPLESVTVFLDHNGNGRLDVDTRILEPDSLDPNRFVSHDLPEVVLTASLPGSSFIAVNGGPGPSGQPDDVVFAHDGISTWNQDERLRMDFPDEVQAVSIDFIAAFAGAEGRLEAYDDRGTLVGQCVAAGLAERERQTMTVSSAAGNIAYALAWSTNGVGFFDRVVVELSGSEPSARTDAQGEYAIGGLPSGDYSVNEIVLGDWRQTYPGIPASNGRLFVIHAEDEQVPTISELDPRTFAVLTSFAGPAPLAETAGPQGLAVGPHSLFYIDWAPGAGTRLYELDLDSGAVIDTDPIDVFAVDGLAYLDGHVYLDGFDPVEGPKIMAFDPSTDTIVDSFDGPGGELSGLAGAEDLGRLFAIADGVTILGIDPADGSVQDILDPRAGDFMRDLAYVGGELIANTRSPQESGVRIDPVTGELLGRFDLFGFERVVGLGGDGVGENVQQPAARLFAVADDNQDRIVELDPVSGAVLQSLPLPQGAATNGAGLAYDGESLFLVSPVSDQIWQLDPDTGGILDQDTLALGPAGYEGLATLGGKVYILVPGWGDIVEFDPVLDTITNVLDIDLINNGLFLWNGLAASSDPDVLLAVSDEGVVMEIDPVSGLAQPLFQPVVALAHGLAVLDGEIYGGYSFNENGIPVYARDGRVLRYVPFSFDIAALAGGTVAGSNPAAAHKVTLAPGQIHAGADFGNRLFASEIRGRKWDDSDGDGQWDQDESELKNWTVYLDENNNGRLDSHTIRYEPDDYEPGTVLNSARGDVTLSTVGLNGGGSDVTVLFDGSASTGEKIFSHEGASTWWSDDPRLKIRFTEPVMGLSIDFGSDGPPAWGILEVYDVSGNKLDAISVTTDFDRPWQTMSVSRANADIAYAIAGADIDNFGRLDNLAFTVADEPLTTTDAEGRYAFAGLPPGRHTVAEVLPAEWEQTAPAGVPSAGRLFAVRGEQQQIPTIYEIDPTDGSEINSFPGPAPLSLATGPQGLAVGPSSLFYIDGMQGFDQWLYELDLDTGAVIDADLIADEPMTVIVGAAYLDGRIYLTRLGPGTPDQLLVYDPGSDTVVAVYEPQVPLGGGLAGAADLGVLFVTGPNHISALHPSDGSVLEWLTPTPEEYEGLAYVGGELIASVRSGQFVVRYDARTGETLGSFPLGNGFPLSGLGGDGVGMPADSGPRLFTLPFDGSETIAELNPADGTEIRRIPAPVSGLGRERGLAFDGQSLWFVSDRSPSLWQVNPNSGAIVNRFEVGQNNQDYDGVAVLEGIIYLLSAGEGVIRVFDPESGRITRVLEIQQVNQGVWFGNGLAALADPPALVAFEGNDALVLLDPDTGLITQSFELGGQASYGLAVVDGEIYAAMHDGVQRIEVYSPGGQWQRTIPLSALSAGLGGDDLLAPVNAIPQWVDLPAGSVVQDVDFGNRLISGTITGHKWRDEDGDGEWDVNEIPLPDWTIYLDENQNGMLDPSEPRTQTDEAGQYRFEELRPGSYLVSEMIPDGWEQTYPTSLGTGGRLFSLRGIDFQMPTIEEIDPNSGTVLNSFDAPAPLQGLTSWQGLAVGPDSLFYVDAPDMTGQVLYEINPDTGHVIDFDTLQTDWQLTGLAYLDGLVYMPAQQGPLGIQVFDPVSDTIVDTIADGVLFEGGLTAAADLGLLFTTTPFGDILTIDPSTGNETNRFFPGLGGLARALAYVDGALIATVDGAPLTGYRLDPLTGQQLGSFEFQGINPVLGLGADGAGTGAPIHNRRLFAWPDDGSSDIVELSPDTGEEINRFDAPPEMINGASGLAFDGESLFVMDNGLNTVWELDADTGAEIDSDPLEDYFGLFVGLAALGNKVYAVRETDNDIIVFDPDTDTVTDVLDFGAVNPGLFLRGGLAAIRAPDALLAIARELPGPLTIVEIAPATGEVTNSFVPSEWVMTGLAVTDGLIFAGDPPRLNEIFVYNRDGTLRSSFELPYDVYELAGFDLHFDAVGHLVDVLPNQVTADVDFGNRRANAPPTDLALSNTTVLEDEPAGTVVGTFSTTDPDDGDTFTYTLTAGAGDTDNLSFRVEGDQLKTAEVFDYQAQSTFSIRVRTTDSGGAWHEEPFTITVTPVGLVLTDMTMTGSGFSANFSRPLDTTELSLYDVEAGTFGLPDVLLEGLNGGPIAGSLIVGTSGVTFIATGGVLPADTYTLSLRSGADAFRDEAGEPLDGNGDGVPGDDFVDTFVVAPEPVVLSLPDFTRGPGQPVSVPVNNPGLPVMLYDERLDGNDLISFDVTITYDPSLLNIRDAFPGPDLPAGTTLTADANTPGIVTLSLSTTGTPFARGTQHLVDLAADIPADAPYAAAGLLVLSNLRVTDTTEGAVSATADDAGHVVAYLGETTGNEAYSGLDAQRVARVAVGLDSGFEAYPRFDPVLVGDVTINGDLSGLDAQRIAQEVVGLDPDEIPPLPNPVGPQRLVQTVAAQETSGAFETPESRRLPKSAPPSAVPYADAASLARPVSRFVDVAALRSPSRPDLDAPKASSPLILALADADRPARDAQPPDETPAVLPAPDDLEPAIEDDLAFDLDVIEPETIDAVFARR